MCVCVRARRERERERVLDSPRAATLSLSLSYAFWPLSKKRWSPFSNKGNLETLPLFASVKIRKPVHSVCGLAGGLRAGPGAGFACVVAANVQLSNFHSDFLRDSLFKFPESAFLSKDCVRELQLAKHRSCVLRLSLKTPSLDLKSIWLMRLVCQPFSLDFFLLPKWKIFTKSRPCWCRVGGSGYPSAAETALNSAPT